MAMNRRFPRDFVLTAVLLISLGVAVFFAQEWSGTIASYMWSVAACLAVIIVTLELTRLRSALSNLHLTIARDQ